MLWDVVKLGDISELITKGTTPTSVGFKFLEEGINFVKIESISLDGQFLPQKFAKISSDCNEALKRSQLKEGDILFSIAGALGRTALVTADILPANTNQALAIIRLKKEIKISKEYLLLALMTGVTLEQVEKHRGGVAQQNLSLGQMKEFNIPLPPINEQKRIVAILDQAFAEIERARANAQQNLNNARELFESYLQQVFSQRGDGWVVNKLEKLTTLITKGSSPKWQGISYVEAPGVLFVTSENVGANKMLYKKTKFVEDAFNKKDKKSILKKGDVLTNIVGASIGRTAIFDRDDNANINQAVCLIRCDVSLLNNEYLSYLLNSPYLIQILHDNEVNNARANLSLTFFRNLDIPTPSIREQERVILRLRQMESEIDNLEDIYKHKVSALDELKKSILQKAFSGELSKAVAA